MCFMYYNGAYLILERCDNLSKVRLPITMSEDLRADLEEMSKDLNMSKNQLTLLALYSLVANYKKSGSFIFVDLLNPEHKEK